MEIKGRVHCFFEQSGTFKKAFEKLGFSAIDYDIKNDFEETDVVCDIFAEIENAESGINSIFDGIGKNDLIIAFFPCIYFCQNSQMLFNMSAKNYRKLSDAGKVIAIRERARQRGFFYEKLLALVEVCISRGLRLIIENPWTMPQYLANNFLKNPDIIDNDRTLRGDYFKKKTAYWFFNCEPTHGLTIQRDKPLRKVEETAPSKKAGECSAARSMISPDYARNFINDFVTGATEQRELTLF